MLKKNKLIPILMIFFLNSIILFSAPLKANIGHYDTITDVKNYTGSNSTVLSVSNDESIIIWDLNTNSIIKTIELYKGYLTSLAVSPTGKYFIASNDQGFIFIFEYSNKSLLFSEKINKGKISSIAFTSQDDVFICAGLDGNIVLYDISKRSVMKGLSMPAKIMSMAISPDKTTLVAGGEGGNIYIIPVNEFNVFSSISNAHSDWVTGITFSPDSRFIASVSWDLRLKIFSLQDSSNISTNAVATNKPLNSVSWSNDNMLIAVGSSDSNIYVYNAKDYSFEFSLRGHKKQVFQTTFLDTYKTLVSVGADAFLNVWDIDTKSLIKQFTGY